MEWRLLLSPVLLILSLLSLLPQSFAQTAEVTTINGVRYVTATDDNGQSVYVRDNRQPSLYTGNYGDCLGDSSINVTRFDAAYYKDNMTVLFHLAGDTSIVDEGLMSESCSLSFYFWLAAANVEQSVHCRLCLRRVPIRARVQSLQRQH